MAITGTGIQAMVSDWLDTPVNGYLGSGYGSDTRALLQRPPVRLCARRVPAQAARRRTRARCTSGRRGEPLCRLYAT